MNQTAKAIDTAVFKTLYSIHWRHAQILALCIWLGIIDPAQRNYIIVKVVQALFCTIVHPTPGKGLCNMFLKFLPAGKACAQLVQRCFYVPVSVCLSVHTFQCT